MNVDSRFGYPTGIGCRDVTVLVEEPDHENHPLIVELRLTLRPYITAFELTDQHLSTVTECLPTQELQYTMIERLTAHTGCGKLEYAYHDYLKHNARMKAFQTSVRTE